MLTNEQQKYIELIRAKYPDTTTDQLRQLLTSANWSQELILEAITEYQEVRPPTVSLPTNSPLNTVGTTSPAPAALSSIYEASPVGYALRIMVISAIVGQAASSVLLPVLRKISIPYFAYIFGIIVFCLVLFFVSRAYLRKRKVSDHAFLARSILWYAFFDVVILLSGLALSIVLIGSFFTLMEVAKDPALSVLVIPMGIIYLALFSNGLLMTLVTFGVTSMFHIILVYFITQKALDSLPVNRAIRQEISLEIIFTTAKEKINKWVIVAIALCLILSVVATLLYINHKTQFDAFTSALDEFSPRGLQKSQKDELASATELTKLELYIDSSHHIEMLKAIAASAEPKLKEVRIHDVKDGTVLPEELFSISSIETVYLRLFANDKPRRGEILRVPASMAKFVNLENLDIAVYVATDSSKDAEATPVLSELIIPDLSALTNLKSFTIRKEGKRKIAHIGVEGSLPAGTENLAIFNFIAQKESLPEFKGPRALKTLHIENNTLDVGEFPQWVINYPSITALGLKGTQIVKLPDNLSILRNVEKLNLERNNLSVIPEGISGLAALKELDISGNPITSMPQSMVSLVNLKKIRAANTCLPYATSATIPQPLRNLLPHVTDYFHSRGKTCTNSEQEISANEGTNQSVESSRVNHGDVTVVQKDSPSEMSIHTEPTPLNIDDFTDLSDQVSVGKIQTALANKNYEQAAYLLISINNRTSEVRALFEYATAMLDVMGKRDIAEELRKKFN